MILVRMTKENKIGIILLIIMTLLACATPHKYGERDQWSAAMHFKVAQDTANRKAYKQALIEYDEILEKFADQFQYVVEAQYERAVILYRMKRYKESYEILSWLKSQIEDSNIYWPSSASWLQVMVPIMHGQVSAHVYKAQEKERVAKEKAEQKAEAKAQKQRVKELERARKAREKEQARAAKNSPSIPPKDSGVGSAVEHGSVQTAPVEGQETGDEQIISDDQVEQPERQDEWDMFEPFLPLA